MIKQLIVCLRNELFLFFIVFFIALNVLADDPEVARLDSQMCMVPITVDQCSLMDNKQPDKNIVDMVSKVALALQEREELFSDLTVLFNGVIRDCPSCVAEQLSADPATRSKRFNACVTELSNFFRISPEFKKYVENFNSISKENFDVASVNFNEYLQAITEYLDRDLLWMPSYILKRFAGFGIEYLNKYIDGVIKNTYSRNPYVRRYGILTLGLNIMKFTLGFELEEMVTEAIYSGDNISGGGYIDNFIVRLSGKTFGKKSERIIYWEAKAITEGIKKILDEFLPPLISPQDSAHSKFLKRFLSAFTPSYFELLFTSSVDTCSVFEKLGYSLLVAARSVQIPQEPELQKKAYKSRVIAEAMSFGSMINAACKWRKHDIGMKAQQEKFISPFKGQYFCTSQLNADGDSYERCTDLEGGRTLNRKISVAEMEFNRVHHGVNRGLKSTGDFIKRQQANVYVQSVDRFYPLEKFWITVENKINIVADINTKLYRIVDEIFDELSWVFRLFFKIEQDNVETIEDKYNVFRPTTVVQDEQGKLRHLSCLVNTDKRIKVIKVGSDSGCTASAALPEFTLHGCIAGVAYALPIDYIVGDDITGKYLHGILRFMVKPQSEPASNLVMGLSVFDIDASSPHSQGDATPQSTAMSPATLFGRPQHVLPNSISGSISPSPSPIMQIVSAPSIF